MSSAFDLPIDLAGNVVPRGNRDPAIVREQVARMLLADHELESGLMQTAWFPYRRLEPVERTREFINAYDRMCVAYVDKNPHHTLGGREGIRARGNYLSREELLAPWLKTTARGTLKLSQRWADWLRARRFADVYGMIYDDFAAGAITAAHHRGWRGYPGPNLLWQPFLTGADGSCKKPEWTILGFEAKVYSTDLKLTQDPYFHAAAYTGEPLQRAYLRFVAMQLRHRHGTTSAGERTWRRLQESGKISASLSIECALS